jgi:ribose transport system permease protein
LICGASTAARPKTRAWAGRFGVPIFLVVMLVAFSAAMPDRFATGGNFRAIIESQAVLLLLAVAATVPLRAGDFDLSIASMMTATAAMGATILAGGGSLVLVVALSVAMGVAVGLINGFFVVKIGVDSFITTLGSLTALTGATFAISDSEVIFGFDGGVLALARTELLGLPLSVWYGWLLVAIAWYVYERTPAGRYLVFVGGGRDVARLAGLKVDRIRMGAFVASSTIAALAGVVLIGDLGAFDPSLGPSYLLQPFAAAFLGAATISVGRFNALGTLIGLYLLVVGITGLQLLGAATWVSEVFNGLALIMAVTVARLIGGRGGQAEARA